MNKLIKHLLWLFFCLTVLKTTTAQIENVLVLDGCTNHFEIPDNDLLDYNQTLSIECWVRPNCGDGNNMILTKQWCQGQFGYYLSVNDGKLFWSFSSSGACTSPNTHRSINTEIAPNQFTHVAVVHTQTEIKLFVNGLEVISEQNQGVFGTILNSSEPLRIGAYKNYAGDMTNHFSGLIDEVRLWDIALNEALIQQRKDTPLQGDETGLVLYLNMEQSGQGSSLTLENQSSYGTIFNATSNGSTSFSPYIIHNQNYDDDIINLGEDIFACTFPFSISIPNDNYKSILWSNGESDTEIIVSNPGDYSVIVETELCRFYHDTLNIELSTISTISNEYFICENDTTIINNIEYYQEGTYYDTIPGSGIACDTVLENSISFFPISESDLQLETCPNSTVNYEGQELEPGSITSFILMNANGCDSIVTVEVFPSLVLIQEVDLIACEGTQLDYNGTVLLPNSTTEFVYSSIDGCDSIVTVNVGLSISNNSFLGNDTIVCAAQFSLFSPNENTLWNDEIMTSDYDVTSTGNYYALFIDSLGCTNSDTIYVEFIESGIEVPNAFTPNGDGNSDCFKPVYSIDFEAASYKLSIYNRWGEKVFETTNINECWNGTFKGEPLHPSVFFWTIEAINDKCNKSEFLKGDLTLIK